MKINTTEAQDKVIAGIYDPFIKPNQPGQGVYVYEVKEDHHVALWVIDPDGEYFVETLQGGWYTTAASDKYADLINWTEET